jgi:hypothetical protein
MCRVMVALDELATFVTALNYLFDSRQAIRETSASW